MKRILLALFALLGLVAQVAPASACVNGAATEIGASLATDSAVRALAARPAVLSATDAPAARTSGSGNIPVRPRHLRVLLPTVMLQADRARE